MQLLDEIPPSPSYIVNCGCFRYITLAPAHYINAGVWITIFWIIAINLFGVKVFREVKFYLSTFKAMIVLGPLILSLVITCEGGPDHEVRSFKYWSNPWAFDHFIHSKHIYQTTILATTSANQAQRVQLANSLHASRFSSRRPMPT